MFCLEKSFSQVFDLSKRQGKVLIVGEEGAGKTLLTTAIGVNKMLRGMQDCWKSYKQVDEYNKLGFHFSKNYEHLVFSNYDINCSGTRIPSRKNYILDPYKVGLYCEDYYTDVFPPYAFLIVTEAQTVFNAYMWQYIRPEVRRFWETSRQADVEIILDTNQPNLIYNGMRSLVNRVLYLYQKTEPIEDRNGIVVGHKLFIKEFKTYDLFDKYRVSNKQELVQGDYVLNLHKCYYKNFDSKQCRWLQLKGREQQDYVLKHFSEIKSIEDVNEFVDNFGVVAPEGYYLNSKKNKQKDVVQTEMGGNTEDIIF